MLKYFCDRCTNVELSVDDDNKLRGRIGGTKYTITISCEKQPELGPNERQRQPKELYKMLCTKCKMGLMKRASQDLARLA